MKRLIATLLVATAALIGSFQAKAIEDPFPKGSLILGAQFGVLPGIGATAYGDYVLVDSWWRGHFSVGFEFGYSHHKQKTYDVGLNLFGDGNLFDVTEGDPIKYNKWAFMTRAAYGLNITDRFEVHAGVLAGVGLRPNFASSESQLDYKKLGPCFAGGGFLGLRFFFTEHIAGSFETQFTTNSPWANLGICFLF